MWSEFNIREPAKISFRENAISLKIKLTNIILDSFELANNSHQSFITEIFISISNDVFTLGYRTGSCCKYFSYFWYYSTLLFIPRKLNILEPLSVNIKIISAKKNRWKNKISPLINTNYGGRVKENHPYSSPPPPPPQLF